MWEGEIKNKIKVFALSNGVNKIAFHWDGKHWQSCRLGEGNIKILVLDMLNLRCSIDIQVEMS